ncbi:MAG: zinc ribbon domain-containing protein [Aigarchaeota archaeon]|nr:zinc ribbon domain-containing protein [Candidatus Calditenuaceae archaeon]
MSPARVAGSIIAAFGGAVLAPVLGYFGATSPFPPTAVGLLVVTLAPALLCRSFTTAATASITGTLAAIIFWLTVIYNPITDALVSLISGSLLVDPILAYIFLMVAMAPVSGAIGLTLAPGEEAVIRAALERGPAGEGEAGGEEAAAAAAGRVEAPPREGVGLAAEAPAAEAEAVGVVEEVVYVRCIHCGEPVPEEAVFCPSCGKRVKGVGG